MSAKIPNRLAEAVGTVARGRQLDVLSTALHECVAQGLVAIDAYGEQTVTDAGAAVAQAHAQKTEAARAKRRAAARTRSQAMTSLGLTRTRYGWE
ncbi:MAG: hypothetical protein ACLQVI_24840 [Polyangiaceae bacterium]